MKDSSNTQALLKQLRCGSEVDAIEAAKLLIDSDDQQLVAELAGILRSNAQPHSREAAAYALAWHSNNKAIAPLLECADDVNELDLIRGQAIEGLAIHLRGEPIASELRAQKESFMISLLQSRSPTLRFWACFGLGTLECSRAIPYLREISQKDEDVCPGWWFVREEAEDALEWIAGRSGADHRIPVHLRNTNRTEPGAAPNGGPAASLDNSNAPGGPPSVS